MKPKPFVKWCRYCKRILPGAEFYRCQKSPDGIGYRCRECSRGYNASPERRKRIKESGRTNRKEVERRYKRSEKGRAVGRKVDHRRRRETPEKMRAKDKVKYAIKTGRLVRRPCEVCEAENTHAHHDDYSKPLEVRWLCPAHHRTQHNTLRKAS